LKKLYREIYFLSGKMLRRGSGHLQRIASTTLSQKRTLKRMHKNRRKLIGPPRIPNKLGNIRWVPHNVLYKSELEKLELLPRDYTLHPSEYRPTTLFNRNPKVWARKFPNGKAMRQIEWQEDYGEDCVYTRKYERPKKEMLKDFNNDEDVFEEYRKTRVAWWAEDRIIVLYNMSQRFQGYTLEDQRSLLDNQDFKELFTDLYEDVEIRRVYPRYACKILSAMANFGLGKSKIMERLYEKTHPVVGSSSKEDVLELMYAIKTLQTEFDLSLLPKVFKLAWHFRREYSAEQLCDIAETIALSSSWSESSTKNEDMKKTSSLGYHWEKDVINGICHRLRTLFFVPNSDYQRARISSALTSLGSKCPESHLALTA